MKKILFLTMILALGACTPKAEKPKETPQAEKSLEGKPVEEPKCGLNCGGFDLNLCNDLISAEAECRKLKNEKGCSSFVAKFKTALETQVHCINTCQPKSERWREYDKSVTHFCDNIDRSDFPKITERAGYLIPTLKWKSAQEVVASKAFSNIIDGAMGDLKKAQEKAQEELKAYK